MRWPAKDHFQDPHAGILLKRLRTQERLNQLFEDFMPMEEWGGGKVYTPAIDIRKKTTSFWLLQTCRELIKRT